MADVNFIIKLEQDCTKEAIVFADITDNGGTDGYGNVGTRDRGDIKTTQFTIKKADGTTYSTGISGYNPSTAFNEIKLTPGMFNSTWKTFDDMSYTFIYTVFFNQFTSGSIAADKTYMVYDGGAAGYITYKTVKYYDGETFVGVSGTNSFTTSGSAKVTEKQDYEYEANFLYWCNVRRCIRNLMMKYRLDKCEKNNELLKSLSNYDTELNAIIVTYEEGNVDEASEGIQELQEFCNVLFKECGC
jgi:hypothetical protein